MSDAAPLPGPAEPGCFDCARALDDPEHGLYMMGCVGCQARMLSFGPQAWQALQAPVPDPEPLRCALLATFGEQRYLDGRRRLWAWLQLRAAAATQQPEHAAS